MVYTSILQSKSEEIMKSKRRLLKSLAIGGVILPTQWSKPVVNNVVLPAHAQTSIPAGCYEIIDGFSLFWPGGVGPEDSVNFFADSSCQNFVGPSLFIIVAASTEEAEAILPCDTIFIQGIPSPGLPPGLSFFTCVEG